MIAPRSFGLAPLIRMDAETTRRHNICVEIELTSVAGFPIWSEGGSPVPFHVRRSGLHPPRATVVWIPRLLAIVLLSAAGLKIFGFGADPVARVGVFSSPAFQVFLIIFEIGLGIWLVSGTQGEAAWVAGLATFAAFAVISFYQGMVGQSSCGCLGNRIRINPWIML